LCVRQCDSAIRCQDNALRAFESNPKRHGSGIISNYLDRPHRIRTLPVPAVSKTGGRLLRCLFRRLALLPFALFRGAVLRCQLESSINAYLASWVPCVRAIGKAQTNRATRKSASATFGCAEPLCRRGVGGFPRALLLPSTLAALGPRARKEPCANRLQLQPPGYGVLLHSNLAERPPKTCFQGSGLFGLLPQAASLTGVRHKSGGQAAFMSHTLASRPSRKRVSRLL
jgi:hypothetical protein